MPSFCFENILIRSFPSNFFAKVGRKRSKLPFLFFRLGELLRKKEGKYKKLNWKAR